MVVVQSPCFCSCLTNVVVTNAVFGQLLFYSQQTSDEMVVVRAQVDMVYKQHSTLLLDKDHGHG